LNKELKMRRLKLKDRKLPSAAEIQRLFEQNRKEWLNRKSIPDRPLAPLSKPDKSKATMRPAWHFHSDYGSGSLSPGYTEYLAKRGRTIHNPVIWVKKRKLRLRNRNKPKLRLKRR
jgi:hypothetical protein